MKKSITVLFLLLLALCGATGAFAQSESDFEVTVTNGRVTITGYTGRATTVVIPATISGKPVTDIAEGAFRDCISLSSVNIPASVTSIGWGAFYGCASLTLINIPAGVTSIEPNAFSDCTSLTAISVEPRNTAYSSRDGVLFNKAGDELIIYPVGKKEVKYAIPVGVTSIGRYTFSKCTSLISISIPEGVISIRAWAFSYCTGLTSISIPSSVTAIDTGAFAGFTGAIRISANVNMSFSRYSRDVFHHYYQDNGSKAGVYTWSGGTWSYVATPSVVQSAESPISESDFAITVTNGAVTITKYTGSGVSVVIPARIWDLPVTEIGWGAAFPGSTRAFYGAFQGCTGLTSISIPESVTTIVALAFSDCTSLIGISVDPHNRAYSSRDGVLFNKAENTLIQYPPSKKETQYAIPAGVTIIGYAAFQNCTGLTSISIPPSVTSIRASAFQGCTGLTSIRIGTNVELGSNFENNFSGYYDTNGNKAGVYTFRNGAWSYSER